MAPAGGGLSRQQRRASERAARKSSRLRRRLTQGALAISAILDYGESLRDDNGVISGNTAAAGSNNYYGGGCVYFNRANTTTLTSTDSPISGNDATNRNRGGLQVYNAYYTVYVKNDTFSGN